MDRLKPYRGYTFDPWPCCGEKGGLWNGQRPRDKFVCDDCRALIAEGKAARARLAAEQLGTYWWHERDYAMPGYYGDYAFSDHCSGDPVRDDLEKAIFQLVGLVAVEAPADVPADNPATWTMVKDPWDPGKKRRQNEDWPHVFDTKRFKGQHGIRWGEWKQKIQMQVQVRDAIDRLDAAIRAALGSTYAEGKRRGRSLLAGLAAGEISTAKYDAAMKEDEADTDE